MQKRLILASLKNGKTSTGFTLVELLIVLTIIAVLAIATILILNPAEILKKARDSQRMSDLQAIKNAIALYVTTASSPTLGSTSSDATCVGGSGQDRIWLSVPLSTGSSTSAKPAGSDFYWQQVNGTISVVDGSGWIPVNLGQTTGGSAISNWPIDPNGSVSNYALLTNADRIYRYTCNYYKSGSSAGSSTFEVDANLESSYYTSGSTNAESNDGGNNTNLFEIGTALDLLPSTDDF